MDEDEDLRKISEEEKSIFMRNELKENKKKLVEEEKKDGVEKDIELEIFKNNG
ncbi:DNA-damage-inducible protein DinD [Escherichia coli]|nr:DNA-damage-inducible protein DinD [Escherichia coli]